MKAWNVFRAGSVLLLASTAMAQVPEGWFVYGLFGPTSGPIGVYTSHPRTPGAPTEITNLQGDLVVTGSSCILYRESDGAILVGERAPTGASVDLHMIYLNGTSVLLDASFSVGVGGPCCGEIPQMALLPDGRVVVAATDVDGGPLQNYLTTQYGWQGLGIVNTQSGLVSPINVTNGATIVDVFNGLALSPDAQTIYAGTYVSSTQGDIWAVPVTGGAATLVASVPAGLSNMAFDHAGDLWVTTLDAAQGLFRVDVVTGAVIPVPQSNGALNALALEDVTGNLAVASARAGYPGRSIFWMELNGTHHLLSDPGFATPSGIAVRRNPSVVGAGTPGNAAYRWAIPNPGGLPLAGNLNFSLTIDATGPSQIGLLAATAASAAPVSFFGAEVFLDLSQTLFTLDLPAPPITIPLPIPALPGLVDRELYFQSVHIESPTQLAASPALKVTIL